MIYIMLILAVTLCAPLHGGELPLSFQLDAASYLEPGEGSYVKLRVAISYDELLFLKQDDGYVATYGISYRVHTAHGQRVHSGHLNGRVQVFSFDETNKNDLLAREEIILQLPSGTYAIKVVAEDKENLRRGVHETDVQVMSANKGATQLSSLSLTGDGPGRQSLPDTLPSQCRMITLNAEFYAPPDTTGGYHVPLAAEVFDQKGKLVNEASDSILVLDRVTPIEVPLDISALQFGSYEIVLTVGDSLKAKRVFVLPWSILSMVNDYDDAVRLLNYIADKGNIRAFKDLDAEDRTEFWFKFWKDRDPVPSTPCNELMEAYEKRIMYANEHFSAFEKGWKTDMGMIHVMFGLPDEIERHPFDLNSKPYQIWTYYSRGRQFVFVDRTGFGRYDLVSGDYSRR